MNNKQVLFLLRNGLINPLLVKKWEENNKPWKAEENVRGGIVLNWIASIFCCFVAIMLVRLAPIIVSAEIGPMLGWRSLCLMSSVLLCSVIGIGWLRFFRQSPFTQDLSELHHTAHHDIYCLNREANWLLEAAEAELKSQQLTLKHLEDLHGIDNLHTKAILTKLKRTHATLLNFGLCDANQRSP